MAPGASMVVGIAVCELHVTEARSLKEKRRIVHGLLDRWHRRYRVSVAETAHHDLHQRAEIGIAVVGRSEAQVNQLLDELRRLAELADDAVITRWDTDIIQEAER